MARSYTIHHLDDANLCRALRVEGLSYKLIAEKMEIPVSTVWNLCNARTDDGRPGNYTNPHRQPYFDQPVEIAEKCRAMRGAGMTYWAIADALNVSHSTAWRMCNLNRETINAALQG